MVREGEESFNENPTGDPGADEEEDKEGGRAKGPSPPPSSSPFFFPTTGTHPNGKAPALCVEDMNVASTPSITTFAFSPPPTSSTATSCNELSQTVITTDKSVSSPPYLQNAPPTTAPGNTPPPPPFFSITYLAFLGSFSLKKWTRVFPRSCFSSFFEKRRIAFVFDLAETPNSYSSHHPPSSPSPPPLTKKFLNKKQAYPVGVRVYPSGTLKAQLCKKNTKKGGVSLPSFLISVYIWETWEEM